MANPMEKESTLGRMVKSMMENGLMESNKVMECGKVVEESPTLDNGKTVKLMGMVFTNGKTVIDMKGSGKPVYDKVMDLISLPMETLTLGNIN